MAILDEGTRSATRGPTAVRKWFYSDLPTAVAVG